MLSLTVHIVCTRLCIYKYIIYIYIHIYIHIYIWCVRLCGCIFMCIEHAKSVFRQSRVMNLWSKRPFLFSLEHVYTWSVWTCPFVAGDGLVGIRLQLLLSLLRQQRHAGWRSVGDHHRTGPHAILYLGGAGMILDESWISWEVTGYYGHKWLTAGILTRMNKYEH